MPSYMDHASKRAIRENWCRPLLRHIRNNLGYKLTYLGLPSKEGHDILCWLEYLDFVIAFQCRDYPNPSSVEQSKEEILQLEKKLLGMEREKKIKSFSLYDGYIEEVLIKGYDTVGKVYEQEHIVTVYNLDFCNGITVPIVYYDENSDKQEAYKPEAIRELLKFQRRLSLAGQPAKFVMFLTIHSDFFPLEQMRYLRHQQQAELRSYLSKVSRLSGTDKNTRVLKTYIYQVVRDFFCTAEMSPEFLPTIYYQGAPSAGRENWMMHFTIIGVYNRNPSAIALCSQRAETFLNQKFLGINNRRFCSVNTQGISENNANNSSVAAFTNSHLCQQSVW